MCAYTDLFAVIEDRSDFRAGSLPEISGVDGGSVVNVLSGYFRADTVRFWDIRVWTSLETGPVCTYLHFIDGYL